VSNLLQGSLADQSISSIQSQLLTVENQLTTGKQVNQPSDNPAAAAMILQLQKTLDQRTSYASNLSNQQTQLGNVDSTLQSVSNLLLQAQNIASSDVGSTTSQQQRTGDAQIINNLITEVKNLANTSSAGVYLFGGDKGNTAPFVSASGGVQFVGSTNLLQNSVDINNLTPAQVSAANVFGGLSARVAGTSLNPTVTAQTRLTDLGGATSTGVGNGSFTLGNGSTTATLSVSAAETLGDVVSSINAAAVGGITASLTSNGIKLTGGGSDNISVTDTSGTSAAQLGIASGPVGLGNPAVGSSVNPKITLLTPISALNGGAGIDSKGIILSNGATSKTITFPAGGTVESILNAINGAGLGAVAQINSTGTGINVQNSIQGTQLTIGENGGTTASDLGIRSFSPTTPLSELNNGQGVGNAGAGINDFTITSSAVTSFSVSISGDVTAQDVINSINTAATTAGVNVTASFATSGNGIVLTDGTSGGGTLGVTAINASSAAKDLGLTTPAVGNVINGADVDSVTTAGVFTDLQNLANALQTGDAGGITAAGAALTNDYNNVSDARGATGAQVQALGNISSQLTTENLATQQFMSSIQDTDMTSAISEFQTLQTALQASLQTVAKNQNLTLLNFLS
jgi:flagellar hook-associated protein 3 FlgL